MTPRAVEFAAVAVVVGLVTGCATEPGGPWGRIELTAAARFAPGPDRLSDTGALLTVNNEAVALKTHRLHVTRITATFSANTASVEFDPTNPPPGYSLCHHGHCHKDDGTLPTYDEIKLELAGATGDAAIKVTWDVEGGPVAINKSQTALKLGPCQPNCDVARWTLVAWRIDVASLEVSGTVSNAGKTGKLPGPTAFTYALDKPASFSRSADIGFNRENEPLAAIHLDIDTPVELFDDVTFAKVLAPSATSIDLSAAATAASAVRSAFVEKIAVTTDITRSEL